MATALSFPDGRNGRLFALGLTAFAFLLLYYGLVSPLLHFYQDRDVVLRELQLRASQQTGLLGTMPLLQRELQSAIKSKNIPVFTGSTDAIAGAALQEQIQNFAGASNAQLTDAEPLPTEQLGANRRISVRVEFKVQLDTTVKLLRLIKESKPAMIVDDIRLTAAPVDPLHDPSWLILSFKAYAFRLGTNTDGTE